MAVGSFSGDVLVASDWTLELSCEATALAASTISLAEWVSRVGDSCVVLELAAVTESDIGTLVPLLSLSSALAVAGLGLGSLAVVDGELPLRATDAFVAAMRELAVALARRVTGMVTRQRCSSRLTGCWMLLRGASLPIND